MNNLQKIKAAWAMGWSAVIKDVALGTDNEYLVISIPKGYSDINFIWTKGLYGYGHCIQQNIDDLNDLHKITSYKFAGELAGNEEIPEGQKFRVKTDKLDRLGVTGIFHNQESYRICLDHLGIGLTWYDRSELEPYFE